MQSQPTAFSQMCPLFLHSRLHLGGRFIFCAFLKYLPKSDLGLSFTVKKEENVVKEDVFDASNWKRKVFVRRDWMGAIS